MTTPAIGSQPEQQPMVGVEEPHHNDVLCGRGVTTNRHVGNENFRSLVNCNKEVYVSSTKRQKMTISRSIVHAVRALDPPGRFLEKDQASNTWFDIGDKRATEKTSQALRDGAAKLRKRLSEDLSDPAFLSAVFDEDATVEDISVKPKKTAGRKKTKGHRRTQSNPLDLASNYTDATTMWNWQQQHPVEVLHKPPAEPIESAVDDTSPWAGDALAAEAHQVLGDENAEAQQELLEDLQNPTLFSSVFEDESEMLLHVEPLNNLEWNKQPAGHHRRTRSDGATTSAMGNLYSGVADTVPLQQLPDLQDPMFLSAVFEEDSEMFQSQESVIDAEPSHKTRGHRRTQSNPLDAVYTTKSFHWQDHLMELELPASDD